MAVARGALGGRARRALPAPLPTSPLALLLALLLALAACGSTPPTPLAHTESAAHSVPAPPSVPDPSFDWRGLIIVPFGSDRRSLQESLHEVLLFRDDQESAAKPEAEDCYSPEAAPPRLLGQAADHVFLCFRNDRLNRIEAVFSLPTESAAALFARFCAAARQDARPLAEDVQHCEGQDRAATFRARLDTGADAGNWDLSIVVDAAEPAD